MAAYPAQSFRDSVAEIIHLEHTKKAEPTEKKTWGWPMIKDDQWHDGIVYRHTDGGREFHIAENFAEGEQDPRPKEMIGNGVRYQEVKYTWNKGQPIVDFGTFKASIVDISLFPIIPP